MNSLRNSLLLLAVLLLAGCATTPPPATRWVVEDINAFTRFTLHGKVGFRRGEEGGSAALVWQQDGQGYDLLATGPLGQGATRIHGNNAFVRIEQGRNAQESTRPEVLLGDAIGWPVSVNSLAYWVRGLAAPDAKDQQVEIEYDTEGRPSRIRQYAWDIRLDRWRADDGLLLPHRVVATGGDSRVTLLIERWERTAPAPAR